jgi:hypothetical protein
MSNGIAATMWSSYRNIGRKQSSAGFGLDEEMIRKYIRNQEEADQREDEQLKLGDQL